jgi:sulfur relay (sulfurtransferase) DsrF/TusC family protein
MNPTVLFVIASDPRSSPRPAEAIRIAAGVGTWKKVDIDIYLAAAAVPLLEESESSGELIDDENFDRYLPIIGEWGRPVYVEAKGAERVGSDRWRLPCELISGSRLAELAAGHQYVLRF